MKTGKTMRVGRSNYLKQWFLLRLFEDCIGQLPIRACLADPEELLSALHNEAIRTGAAESVQKKAEC